MTRRKIVDVASFQGTNSAVYGAQGVIVKTTEGTGYINPKATAQIASARKAGLTVDVYHFANFSSNSIQANTEANYAVSFAKRNLPSGTRIWLDWETGDGNVVSGNRNANTTAILSFMDIITKNGYKTGLYSGASVLRNNVDTARVLAKYPNCLWVASYPVMSPVTEPNFNYFPSMNGVAMWQFTSNWKGMNVDCSVELTEPEITKKEDDEMTWHPEVAFDQLGVFKVNRNDGANLYSDSSLNKVVGKRDYGSTFKIYRAKNGAVQVGANQWFSQADGLTKINPLAVNPKAPAVCKITNPAAYTQTNTKPGKGIQHLSKGTTWKVFGREGKYLIVYGKDDGKYLDAAKAVIVL